MKNSTAIPAEIDPLAPVIEELLGQYRQLRDRHHDAVQRKLPGANKAAVRDMLKLFLSLDRRHRATITEHVKTDPSVDPVKVFARVVLDDFLGVK